MSADSATVEITCASAFVHLGDGGQADRNHHRRGDDQAQPRQSRPWIRWAEVRRGLADGPNHALVEVHDSLGRARYRQGLISKGRDREVSGRRDRSEGMSTFGPYQDPAVREWSDSLPNPDYWENLPADWGRKPGARESRVCGATRRLARHSMSTESYP